MISLDRINKMKEKGWWYDTPSEEYISALRELDIDPNSTIGQFISMQRMVPHSPAKELFYIISVGFYYSRPMNSICLELLMD